MSDQNSIPLIEEDVVPPAPEISETIPEEERYFLLLASAIRVCAAYNPKFGQGRKGGLSVEQFQQLYGADPFYH